jgi:hypothetical protein
MILFVALFGGWWYKRRSRRSTIVAEGISEPPAYIKPELAAVEVQRHELGEDTRAELGSNEIGGSPLELEGARDLPEKTLRRKPFGG